MERTKTKLDRHITAHQKWTQLLAFVYLECQNPKTNWKKQWNMTASVCKMHNATEVSLKYNQKKKAFAGLLPELF